MGISQEKEINNLTLALQILVYRPRANVTTPTYPSSEFLQTYQQLSINNNNCFGNLTSTLCKEVLWVCEKHEHHEIDFSGKRFLILQNIPE